jgi:ribosomal protein L12E/L44/L45/RPP1/RPP2
VAILDRARAHRTFRRLQGPRLEELITESRAAAATETAADEPEEPQEPSSDDPPTGPSSAGDGIPK